MFFLGKVLRVLGFVLLEVSQQVVGDGGGGGALGEVPSWALCVGGKCKLLAALGGGGQRFTRKVSRVGKNGSHLLFPGFAVSVNYLDYFSNPG